MPAEFIDLLDLPELEIGHSKKVLFTSDHFHTWVHGDYPHESIEEKPDPSRIHIAAVSVAGSFHSYVWGPCRESGRVRRLIGRSRRGRGPSPFVSFSLASHPQRARPRGATPRVIRPVRGGPFVRQRERRARAQPRSPPAGRTSDRWP